MPSWVALGATVLSTLIARFLALPLILLQRSFPFVRTPAQVLRLPFNAMGSAVNGLAVLVQALLLLEGLAVDHVGDLLNGAVRSSGPAAQLSTLESSLASARSKLSLFQSETYPASLSALFADQLNLPELPEGSETAYTDAEIEEWHQGSMKLKQGMETGIDSVVGLWIEILDSHEPAQEKAAYLGAVQAELGRIQADRPTKSIYLASSTEDEAQAAAEADAAAAAEERAQLDTQFEAFVNQVVPESTGARAALDAPLNPNNPSGPTFRQTLREQFDAMLSSSSGSPLGAAQAELGRLFGGEAGMGAPLEPGETRDYDNDYTPGAIPLMVHHLLRDQLNAAIVSSSPSPASDPFPEDADAAKILPPFLRSTADDYLSFWQRAVRIDLRAAELARSMLGLFTGTPSQATPSSPPPAAISPSALRQSPYPTFVKELDKLLTLTTERWLSKHQFALTAFHEQHGMMGLKRAEQEVTRLEREVGAKKEWIKGGKEGKAEL